MRILVSGFYGRRNLGDDVFCYVASYFARNGWESQDLRFLAEQLPVLHGPGVPVFRHRHLRRLVSLYEAGRSDAIIQFGGSTLTRLSLMRRDHALLARARMANLLALGVSVGPFRSNRDREDVRGYLSSCQRVVVRDKASMERAQQLGIDAELGIDPAVMMAAIGGTGSSENPGRPHVLVSLGHDNENIGRDSIRLDLFAAALREMLLAGLDIRILVMNENVEFGDLELSIRLALALGSPPRVAVVRYDGNPLETYTLFRRADIVLSTRLHGAILAYAAQTPFFLMNYHAKCADFCERVSAGPNTLWEDDADPVELAEALLSAGKGQWQLPGLSIADAVDVASASIGNRLM